MKDYRARYAEFIEAIRVRVMEHYGEGLVSLVLFGSVARGRFRPDSDIDILIVAENLPKGRAPRVLDFQCGVEGSLKGTVGRLHGEGIYPLISPIIKTPEEVRLGSPLFLEMVEDAKIVVDRGDFFLTYLRVLDAKLKEMGARKVRFKGGTDWILKPGYQPGDIIEL